MHPGRTSVCIFFRFVSQGAVRLPPPRAIPAHQAEGMTDGPPDLGPLFDYRVLPNSSWQPDSCDVEELSSAPAPCVCCLPAATDWYVVHGMDGMMAARLYLHIELYFPLSLSSPLPPVRGLPSTTPACLLVPLPSSTVVQAMLLHHETPDS